jgi:hypothetical protein
MRTGGIQKTGTEQSLTSSEAGPEDHLKHGHWTENGALTI